MKKIFLFIFSISNIAIADFFKIGSGATTFNETIYFVGGGHKDKSEYTNDIWKSSNGFLWEKLCKNKGLNKSAWHSLVSFRNRLWLIGGHNEKDLENKILSSADGETWTQTGHFPLPIQYHISLVFDDKLWVIGGWDKNMIPTGRIWVSNDGKLWTLVGSLPSSSEAEITAQVFNGKIWLIGSKIWSSSNGKDWVEISGKPPFSGRIRLNTFSIRHHLWVFGGQKNYEGSFFNDFFSTKDGLTWGKKLFRQQIISPRIHVNIVPLKESIFIIGGETKDGLFQEIYKLDDPQKLKKLRPVLKNNCLP